MGVDPSVNIKTVYNSCDLIPGLISSSKKQVSLTYKELVDDHLGLIGVCAASFY